MSYTDTFRVSYDDDIEVVTVSVKQSEHTVLEMKMTYTTWEELIEHHKDENAKYMSMAIPVSGSVTQYIRVPTRDFRVLVAEYELKMNSTGK